MHEIKHTPDFSIRIRVLISLNNVMGITLVQSACLPNSSSSPHLEHALRLSFNTIQYLLIAHLDARISASLLSTRMQLGAKLDPSGSKLLQPTFKSPRIFWYTAADSLRMSAHTIGRPKARQHMNWDSDLYCAQTVHCRQCMCKDFCLTMSQANCKLALPSCELELYH
jgi:hypothetical protein